MGNVGKQIGGQMRQNQQNKLAQDAYMGDENAMSQLMGVNPSLAQKIQSGKQKGAQNKLVASQKAKDRTMKIEDRQRKILTENNDLFQESIDRVGQITDFSQAKKAFNQEKERLRPIVGDGVDDFDYSEEMHEQLQSSKKTGMASAKTEIFADGSVLTVLPDGSTEFTDKSGKVLEGDARIKGLQKAFDSESLLAGSKKAATQAITKSGEMFDKLEPIGQSIRNIDESIAAIDDGADTGFIMSKLPSITKASINLDNLQKRMGLDVVSMTTFGALSKGELDVAMSTALPTTLEPKDLREWLVKKRDAQNKLKDYLTDAAMFLGVPGNTIPDFIQLQKLKEKERKAIEKSSKKKEAGEGQEFTEGQTATHPTTGQKMVFKNGNWQSI